MNPQLDNSDSISYNQGNANDDNMIVVKVSEQEPLNDPACEHSFKADPLDTIGDAIYHGCTKPQCGVGYYLQPK